MCTNIVIGGKTVKPSEVKWKSSTTDIKESCTITMPLKEHCKRVDGNNKEQNKVVSEFKPGDAVSVSVGYDGKNVMRFNGFVCKIKIGVPLVIECDGWEHKLRTLYFTRSYKSVTLKALLGDVFAGTGIRVSERCADVTIGNVSFNRAPYDKIFDWMKKELLLTVSFYGNMLYAGVSRYGIPGKSHKLRLGYNVIDDGDLQKIERSQKRNIELRRKTKYGGSRSYKNEMHKYDSTKTYNIRNNLDATYYKQMQDELTDKELAGGCEGAITLFLVPAINKGDVVELDDPKYGTRNGNYFVENIDGSFSPNGGRQKIMLRSYNNKKYGDKYNGK